MASLAFLLVVILPFVSPLPASNSRNLLSETLSIIEKGLGFFSSDYSSINVDGLFGLRLGQGQLIAAENICAKKKSCKGYEKQLKSIVNQLDETCEKALPYLEASDPDYYKRFEKTISKPYILPYTPTKFNQVSLSNMQTGSNSDYNEEKGDRCYSRIMGTFLENGQKIPGCNITRQCLNMMTSLGTSHYAITHQLLYFMVIEHVGCTQQVENFIGGRDIFDIQKTFCQKIYKEADNLVHNGNVKSMNKDLFFEQSVLCGSLGFEDFFRPDWIAMTLKWPNKKEGCMTLDFHDLFNFDNPKQLVKTVEQKAKEAAENIISEAGKKAEEKLEEELQKLSGTNTMRKLLREKAMKGGCMAHASGLAFGTFGSYVHYLIKAL